MATPTIPVSAEGNLGDPIDIRMDIIHPEPVAVVAFPAATVVRTLAQHGEAIRGIQEQLVGVPIQEELMALRFRIDIAEAEIASLRARNKTTEAIEKITRNRERQAREKMERQLGLIQEELERAALTWWNGQIRTLGPEAYTMTWEGLKKKMMDEYCPQKLRTHAEKFDNKRKTDESSRNNHGHQQQPFKKRNIGYNVGVGEKKSYGVALQKFLRPSIQYRSNAHRIG
ncbi:hypothetical protein Tco_1397483 [Tanacetum coccineum]